MPTKPRVFTHSPALAKQLEGVILLAAGSEVSVDDWLLNKEAEGVTLRGKIDEQLFKLRFDLLSGQMNYRRQHGGGRKEPLAKAIGLKHNATPRVLDATAGMGRESYLLAALGCRVTAIERHPVIFALLQDAVSRLFQAEQLPFPTDRITLVNHNSIEYIQNLKSEDFDVIYLDPMFPAREKSAAVKKEMRVFKLLIGDDKDDVELLNVALSVKSKRVVVKRPNYAPFIGGVKPSFQVESKKHRFDVYSNI